MKPERYKIHAAGFGQPHRERDNDSRSVHWILAVVEGILCVNSGQHQAEARAGDILFYRSGFVYDETYDPVVPVSVYFIAFDTGDLLPWLPLRVHDAAGRIRQIVSWIVNDEQTQSAPEMRRLLLEAMLGELRRLCSAPADSWLEDILAFARENMARPLTLDDLAQRGKMSKFAFVRKFKRLCGRTPMEELRFIRLAQAHALLTTSNLPLKTIAPEVGIHDEYQLSNLFRAHFNISPSEARARSLSHQGSAV